MIRKMITIVCAALMILMTLISATQAYWYDTDGFNYDYYYLGSHYSSYNSQNLNMQDYQQGYQQNSYQQSPYQDYYSQNYYPYQSYNPLGANYVYYDDRYYDGNLPVVTGPYPRQYLFHEDMGIEYKYDDFRGYDSFVGYSDVDVYYPSLGRVDIVRNPNPSELDKSIIPEGMKTFGQHVYGYMPGPNGTCAMYVKHYGHEHEWDINAYSCGYNYNYAYQSYTPWLAYKTTPITARSCQSISACEYNYGVACNR
ncbi:hypothetical protein JXB28_05905 [Candidatus Woesearchaeota archaeon]|nr:hypothetical protein [Candidatus Woesearchaeota archaeon]